MKSIGVVRKIDCLGRIVIPKETRTSLNIEIGDSLEVYTEGNGQIILKKFQRGCVFCGEANAHNVIIFKGKLICKDCLENIK